MKEYIEREALMKIAESIQRNIDPNFPTEAVTVLANFLPTADVVEVVRCKDCVWFAPNNGGLWYGCAFDTRHPDDVPKPDDFCSSGERRADDGKT